MNTTGATAGQAAGVAVDAAAGRIYWSNLNGNKISFARLDGTGGGDLTTPGATVTFPQGVAIDTAAGRIYWTNDANKVSFARLDGAGGADLNTTGTAINGPTLPALLKAPVAAGAPVVTGSSTTGATLTCSTGTWAPDQTAALLFRAPQSFAYQWTLDGGDIAGATSNTLSPDVPGTYRCQVTAANQAGAAAQTSAARMITAAALTPNGNSGGPGNPTAPIGNSTGPPSNRFTIGKLKGTRLSVTVEAPGTLTVGDATTTARTDRKTKGKRAQPLLKPTSASGGPGTITIKLALTRTAAKTLEHRHKLTTNARITFTPTGGTGASTTTKLTLKTAKKKRRRH